MRPFFIPESRSVHAGGQTVIADLVSASGAPSGDPSVKYCIELANAPAVQCSHDD
jgi:hypothetical protein